MRYESQVKQRQQKELAQAVIAKVRKELENPKVLQQILQQSVADVESEFCAPPVCRGKSRLLIRRRRNRLLQGPIDSYAGRFATRDSLCCTCVHTQQPLCISQIQSSLVSA